MSRASEFAGFLSLAALVHVGFWAGFVQNGSESAGSEGEATLALMGATGDMTDLVAKWTRPVDAAQAVSPMPTAPSIKNPDVTLPMVPQDMLPAAMQPLSAPIQPPETLPRIDTNTARPAVMNAAPKTSSRPQERPRRQTAAPSASTRPTADRTSGKKPAVRQRPSGATAQTAAGNQSGENAGEKRIQRSASLSKAARQDLLAEWGASIRNRVERRKRYPRGTRDSGTTVLRITVNRSGRLAAVSVVKSSGTKALDQAATNAVQRTRFPAAPAAVNGMTFNFNLPLAFTKN